MKWSISKTIKLGPINLTASKTGLSASIGALGQRVGINTKGQGSVSLGIPGVSGLRYRKTKKLV